MASLPMAWNSGLGCPLAGRGGDERGEEAEWVWLHLGCWEAC